jgi:hypothetical protein
MKIIKGFGLFLKWSGVFLLFLSLIGVFDHPDRVELYESLQQKKEIPAHSAVAIELMKKYGFPQEQIEMIDKIKLRDLRFGTMGRSVAGNAVAVSGDGRERTITDILEFREWAYSKSKSYDWMAFTLIIFGLIIETLVHVKGNREHKIST